MRRLPDVEMNSKLLINDDFQTLQRSFGFWAIIVGLGITLWLAALEKWVPHLHRSVVRSSLASLTIFCSSVITTAAPAILAEIPMGDNWIWMTNAFFLACAAFQPLLGQISDLFGRRWTTLCVVAIFMLGSGICGGASSEATLIAGRAVQGIGSGGILMAFGE